MPVNTAPDCVSLGDAWTLDDQVEELRGKFHLRKKDLDAYRESSQFDIKRNEEVIRNLRQETIQKHMLVAENENADGRVIKEVFKDDRKELLALQRYTAAGAIDEMDQTVCQAAQFLNALRYERQKREAKLVEAKVVLNRMTQIAQASTEEHRRNSTITRLENSLDKAQIKYETASSITTCYHNILDKLREVSLTLPAKLDAMESALLHRRKELKELMIMAKDAQHSKEEAKEQLAKVENEAYESKRQRDAELATTRKEVESRKDNEKTDKRTARAALLVDNSDQKAQELAQEQEKKKRILSNEEVFQRIKEAANVTSIAEALERVASNHKTHEHLIQQIGSLESQRVRLKSELKSLSTHHQDMKYNGDEKLSRGQKCLDEMTARIKEDGENLESYSKQLTTKGEALVNIKKGVRTILDKLSTVKLKPPQHNFTDGDIFAQVELCQKKMEQLQLEMVDFGAQDLSTQPALLDQVFHEFLETRVPKDNMRIKIEPSDTTLAFNHIDSEETHDIMNRLDVKQVGQKLIDARNRPKRKKAKKT